MKIIFAGTPEFAKPCLTHLLTNNFDVCAVYTQPDRPAGRGRHLHASPIKTLALEHNIPVYQPKTLRDSETQNQLKALQADLMIVVAYGLLLPQAILETPRLGCINVHASLLPRWRGAAPIQRAILAGDTETGITIMQMDVGLDTGPMLLKTRCPILETDNANSLHDKLAELGASSLLSALNNIETLTPEIQDDTLATHAPKINKQEAQLDWHKPAIELARAVRAYNPWPMAYTWCGEQRLRIGMAQALETQASAKPGTIMAINPEGIDVMTSNGLLRLEQLQYPGRKMLPCHEFVHALPEEIVLRVLLTSDM